MTGVPVIVLARAPLPGQAKTRLAPALGDVGAARLALRLLRHAVTQALAADIGPVMACVTPDATDPRWPDWLDAPAVTLSTQCGGDLGQRMQRAFEDALRPHDCALLIGTDAPALDAAALRQAAAALAGHDAVFTPAADGGYALVGLRQVHPALFEGMRWSHDRVMHDTRERLRAIGWRHFELPTVHDIDVAADLVHLPAAWRADFAP